MCTLGQKKPIASAHIQKCTYQYYTYYYYTWIYIFSGELLSSWLPESSALDSFVWLASKQAMQMADGLTREATSPDGGMHNIMRRVFQLLSPSVTYAWGKKAVQGCVDGNGTKWNIWRRDIHLVQECLLAYLLTYCRSYWSSCFCCFLKRKECG